jgi:2-dehydro-3-deoxyphosphogalactonate aldolase
MRVDDLIAAGVPPIVAILRGVRPEEVVDIGAALFEVGVRLIEVPMNSPEPLDSIEALAKSLGDKASVGAGTVLSAEAVTAIAGRGGRLIVTPNTDQAVIARAVELDLDPMPGFLSPTEGFQAVAAGARRLKVFPATAFGPAYIRAVREVLPKDLGLWAVGGVSPANLAEWLAAGAEGVGVGSAVYRPGDTPDIVAGKARAFVDAWRAAAG